MVDQSPLDRTLAPQVVGGQEVEEVWVLRGLPDQVRVHVGHRGGEVGHQLARALVQSALDLEGENVSAPPLLTCSGGVPSP